MRWKSATWTLSTAKRGVTREAEPNGAVDDEDFEDEDLVEVRIAVGPDGLAEAVTFPYGEDEETPLIERDEKLEQEIELGSQAAAGKGNRRMG